MLAVTLSCYAQVCNLYTATVLVAPKPTADLAAGQILLGFANLFVSGHGQDFVSGTDLTGLPDYQLCAKYGLLTRYVPTTNTLLFVRYGNNSMIQEVDEQGNVIQSVGISKINAQLAALGAQSTIDFNHEVIRLPNGYTALIAHVERLYTNTAQGPGTVDVLGDEVLVLDTNWNVVWTWNAFDFLDINRPAVLGETCTPSASNGGCNITLAPGCPTAPTCVANDWLHGNSLYYDPCDNNMVISLRHQDWIVKFTYKDATGDGNVVWRLGNGGDFTMLNTHNIPNSWFSHTHDAEFATCGTPRLLTVFDNSNTRYAQNPGKVHSRGQVLSINETAMTADLYLNTDMGAYSPSYGSAAMLDNGDFWFSAGNAIGEGTRSTIGKELAPTSNGLGNLLYEIEYSDTTYRTFRLAAQP